MKKFKLMGLMAMGIAALLTVTTPASAEEAEYRCGDINMDGKVDLTDALLSLKAALGIIELDDEQAAAADVNGDNSVDLTDTVMILKIALGISAE